MECPRCGNTDIQTPRTIRKYWGDERTHICEPREKNRETTGCGLVFKSKAKITEVQIFDHLQIKSEYVPIEDYKKKYLPYDLRKKDLPNQLFEEWE